MEDCSLAHPVPVPEPHACGAGRGAECCAFLTASSNGFECERNAPLDFTLRERAERKEMNAQRIPPEGQQWPECMIFREDGGAS